MINKKFPTKISIKSDDTELELIGTDIDPKTKEKTATYKYTKAIHHLGSNISWRELDFEKLVRKGIIVPID